MMKSETYPMYYPFIARFLHEQGTNWQSQNHSYQYRFMSGALPNPDLILEGFCYLGTKAIVKLELQLVTGPPKLCDWMLLVTLLEA